MKKDKAERKHREDQLRAFLSEARQKQSEIQHLLDEYCSILECETFEEAARRVFHACCKATGAVSGYVALRKSGSDENEVLFLEAGGMSCSVNPELPMPIRGLRAEAYDKAAVVYENDFMQSKWLQFMPPGHVEMRNVMFVPLTVSGKVIGVIGLANKPTDFTEDDVRITAPFGDMAAVSLRRAKDKEALRKSEEKYRQLAESTDAILWEFDILADRWTYVSPQAEKILGFAPEEWTNLQFWRDHLHSEDRDWASEYCAECTERGESHVFEYRFLNKDDGITWLRDVVSVEMQDSRPVKLRGFMIDITDRKKVEDALHESKRKFQASEEKYRILVNNTPDFIYSLDRESRYTAVNQSVCRALGLEAHEIIGKNQRELGYPETLILEWDKLHHKVFNTGKDVETETTTPIPDGTVRTYEVVVMPIFDEKGIVTGIRVTSRDISYRKKMEEEIFKADKLESIGMLAGGIAHDFNNYLATLLGSISLAKLYKNDPKKIIEKLDIIEKASLRAKELSSQLFAFSKGGAPVRKKVYLNSSIVDNVKFTLSGSNIRCNFFIEQGLHMVEIDEGQLSQVLNNIVINAVQAMPEGGIIKVAVENVTIETESHDYFLPLPEGSYVKISITDEGIGIPEKYLLKIFDPFFTTKHKGSGLGLATSYSIIKNHDGYLSVESKLGVGTTFFIFLPASMQEDITITVEGDIFYGTGKILLMDDEEDVLKVTGEMLAILGYDVSFSRDGREAIEIYVNAQKKGQPYDLVIMDLTVPGGMGGKNTIKKLLKKDPAAKSIVYSGYSNDSVMANFRDYGFKGVIKKPFTIEELSKLIHEIISARKNILI